jgi:hypothetical protein
VPAGVLFRTELDRSRAESLRPNSGLLSCVRDWLRRWPIFGSASARDDEMRPDFGRGVVVGPGVVLAKGLWREFRRAKGPLGAGALMAAQLRCVNVNRNTGGRCDRVVTPVRARHALCAD